MPTINNITAERTIADKPSNSAITINAPIIAPRSTAILPHKPITEPINSITTATPKLEPVEIPNIDGPANGLSKVVCINKPATDSDIPHNTAATADGRRVSSKINVCDARVASPPLSTRNMSDAGISTDPINIHITKTTANPTAEAVNTIVLRRLMAV